MIYEFLRAEGGMLILASLGTIDTSRTDISYRK